MNNVALQAFITQFGDKIVGINFDNMRNIRFDKTRRIEHITLVTIGAIDYVCETRFDDYSNSNVTAYHLTDGIQLIMVSDVAGAVFDPRKY